MTTLAQIAQNKKQQARAAFIDAAWAGQTPDRLAELASDAGMEPAAADAIIARIAEARADMQSAGDVVRLRRAATKTKAHADATRSQAEAQIAKLESEADAASFDAENAQRELNAAESAARRVLAVYDEGLLPASRVPKEVLGLMERREHERKAHEAEGAKCAAFNQRNRIRDDVERLERDLRNLSISRDQQEQEARLKDEFERAKAALAAAEARLTDAERAHAKARNGL
jgi:hypothetical protein